MKLYFYPMRKILLLLAYSISCSAFAQSLDFTHLNLHVQFDTLQHKVEGKLQLQFLKKAPVDSFFLNGIRMEYHEVKLNGSEVDYSAQDTGIWIDPVMLKDTNSIDISYTASPRKGIYFIGFGDGVPGGRKQIWTQGQGIDHRHWIPHRDEQTDKVIVDLKIEFDQKYEVVSNGKLVQETLAGNGQKLWHYHMDKPMSSYLIAIAVGKYAQRTTLSADSVLLMQYYYPERAEDYDQYYFNNEEIFNFLQDEIAVAYPWQNYKQVPVQDFRHGAMENTTATIFGDFFLVDEIAFNDQNYTYVNAHELAHQWFGNLITASGSKHHWLHEGFATYYQWLSERNLYGTDYFDYDRHKAAMLIYEASKQDTVPLGSGKAGSVRFYQKGAWLLHMLSQRLGEDQFQKVMVHYLNKHRFGVVNTDSLAVSIEEVTGYNATQFLEQWVQRPGEPQVVVSHNQLKDGKLMIEVEQRNASLGPFDLHAEVALYFADGTHENRMVEVSKDRDLLIFDLPEGEKLMYWNWDPGFNNLARQQEIKPDSMWDKQLTTAVHFLDRFEALQNVDMLEIPAKEQKLIALAEDDLEHFAVRAEALGQLLADNSPKAEKLLIEALKSEDVQYQKEAINLVQNPGKKIKKILPELRQGQSYDLRNAAIHLSINSRSQKANEWLYDEHWEEQPGIPGHKNLVTVLTYRLLIFKDEEAYDQLVDFTSPAYDFLTRINAIQSLAALKLQSQTFVDHLFDALFDPNWKLRKEAKPLLRQIYDSEEGRELIQHHVAENAESWREYQKNIVNRTFDLKLQ